MLVHSPEELAKIVTNQRRKNKMSQKLVGDLVGLKQKTVSAFENKPGSTELDTLFRILASINLDIHISPKGEKTKKKLEWNEEW